MAEFNSCKRTKNLDSTLTPSPDKRRKQMCIVPSPLPLDFLSGSQYCCLGWGGGTNTNDNKNRWSSLLILASRYHAKMPPEQLRTNGCVHSVHCTHCFSCVSPLVGHKNNRLYLSGSIYTSNLYSIAQ